MVVTVQSGRNNLSRRRTGKISRSESKRSVAVSQKDLQLGRIKCILGKRQIEFTVGIEIADRETIKVVGGNCRDRRGLEGAIAVPQEDQSTLARSASLDCKKVRVAVVVEVPYRNVSWAAQDR